MNLATIATLAKMQIEKEILEHSLKLLTEQKESINNLMEDPKISDLEWGDLCGDSILLGKAIMQTRSDIANLNAEMRVTIKKDAASY